MAMIVEGAMTVRSAAEILNVSEKQVQHLGRQGELAYLARGLLDGASVRAFAASRQGRHTRAWSERTAWASIALLTGREIDWLGQAQSSRLRSRLRGVDASGFVAATRHRARVGRFSGHDMAVARMNNDQGTVERRPLPGLVSAPRGELDWYVGADDLDRLASSHGLRRDVRGRFVLRAVTLEDRGTDGGVVLGLVRELMEGEVLRALDSATSQDPREQGVAMRLLDDALEGFRDDD